MPKKEIFRVTAQLQQLASVMNWLEYSGRRLELDPELLLRLQLVAEELFLNTVQHGHPRDPDIELGLCAGEGEVLLTYADHAPAFDPHSRPLPPDPQRGGVGLALIRQLPDHVDYQRRGGQNLISLRFAASREGRTSTP